MPQNARLYFLKLLTAALLLHCLRMVTVWLFKQPTAILPMKRAIGKEAARPDRVRYLSYQPPGGGWNNQRKALENAIVMAKLLNRTLIVRPVAPHGEIIRMKKTYRYLAGYEVYNKMASDSLIPLSKVIDLELLKKLLNIIEHDGDNADFIRKYSNKTWYIVCHNPDVGFWVDHLPSVYDKVSWSMIKARTVVEQPLKLPRYRRRCAGDIERYTRNPARKLVWGVKDKLSKIDVDIIFFSEGSLKMNSLYFINRVAAQVARHWLRKYVNFAYWIRKNVRRIVKRIGQPYNAVHIRRTDFMRCYNFTQKYWLERLSETDPMKMTRKLYISTDEQDKHWFAPFRSQGYKLFFASDFLDIIGPFFNDSQSEQDLIGFHEQLICARASKFVDSNFSTFSLFIRRARNKFHVWEGRDTFWPKWIGEGLIFSNKG